MRFKQGQRFRVIVNSVSFYTTAKQIRDGAGDFISINQALREAMRTLQNMRSNDDATACTTGVAANYDGVQVLINMA